MFFRVLVFLLSFQIAMIPVAVKAETTPEPTGKVTDLQKGQEAPYSGVLLDTVAASKMLANQKFIKLETELKLRKEFSLETSKKAFAYDLLRTEYDSLKKIHVETLNIKERQITDLNNLVREQASSDHNQWWLAGGVIIGIALSIAVFYASVEVSK